MPEVSVVIPSFNHANFIAEAVTSVLAQDFCDIEVIVVDDASSDRSVEIVEGFCDPRLQLIALPQNVGGAEALNIGFANASGAFLAVCNSDDVWESGKISAQLSVMKAAPQLGAVFTQVHWIDGRSQTLEGYKRPVYHGIFRQPNRTRSGWLRHLLQEGNCLCHPSVLMRREMRQAVGPYNNLLRQLPDYEMWLRSVMLSDIFVMPQPLIRFRLHRENTSLPNAVNLTRGAHELAMIARHIFTTMLPEVFLAAFGQAETQSDGSLCDRIDYLLQVSGAQSQVLRGVGAALAYEAVAADPALASRFDPATIYGITAGGAATSMTGFAETLQRTAAAANEAGCAAFAKGQVSEAAACFEKALARDPAFWQARENLMIAAVALGDPAPVLSATTEQVESLSQAGLGALFQAGLDSGRTDLAAHALARLRLSGSSPAFDLLEARLDSRLGSHETALYVASEAISALPTSQQAHAVFAACLFGFLECRGRDALHLWLDSVGLSESPQARAGASLRIEGDVGVVCRHVCEGRSAPVVLRELERATEDRAVEISVIVDINDVDEWTGLVQESGVRVIAATDDALQSVVNASAAEFIVIMESRYRLPEGWIGRLMQVFDSDPTCFMAFPALVGEPWQSPFAMLSEDGILSERVQTPRIDTAMLRMLEQSGSVSTSPVLPHALCTVIHGPTLDRLGGLRFDVFSSVEGCLADAAMRGLQQGYAVRLDTRVVGHAVRGKVSDTGSCLAALVAEHSPIAVLMARLGIVTDPKLQLSRARIAATL